MASTSPPATPFIQWGLLGHVVWVSIVVGIGLVALFSFGLAALSMARDAQRSAALRSAAGALGALVGIAILVALAWGLILIVKKS